MASPRDTDILSIRTSRDLKAQLREWAESREIPLTRLVEEMADLYGRSTEEAADTTPLALIVRSHMGALERELSRTWLDETGRRQLASDEAEALRAEVAALREVQERERATHTVEIQKSQEEVENLTRERDRLTSDLEIMAEHLKQARETTKALNQSLADARVRIETLNTDVAVLPDIKKERDSLREQFKRTTIDKEHVELDLARAREDVNREREAIKRLEESHRREVGILERECEARTAKLQAESERTIAALEREIEKLRGAPLR